MPVNNAYFLINNLYSRRSLGLHMHLNNDNRTVICANRYVDKLNSCMADKITA